MAVATEARYKIKAPFGRAKNSKGENVGTFELYTVRDDLGEVIASVQFVNGETTITDELARSVGFPRFAERFDSEDMAAQPLPPAESLARQIVSDYGYEVRPEFPMRVNRKSLGIRAGIFKDPGEADRIAQARQIPPPAGIPAGSDPHYAVTRPIPEPKQK